ncbi:ROK family protein [Aurantimonas sp. HBX-1]|uniref:ROK family protein n=1 Tax=Aurantimonas sp. HBX-1 TaxID=2906072 RepID=UPI001F18F578|nr:ROK family protein [Aurantimonas sp. HBX-1]UIJ71371.1 ROK family protein [Aurantimonas sp. HBX-1]
MLAKTDADDVRAHNRHAVIDHLRRTPISTRKAVSEATGLSVSAASAIATALLRAGILAEVDDDGRTVRRGRPGKALALAASAATVAIGKLAVGEVSVRFADYAGNVRGEARRDCDLSGLGRDEIVGSLLALLDEAGGKGPRPDFGKLIVAVQGKTDSGLSRILWSPALRARDLDIATPLAAATGAAVEVFNDCSLMPEAFRWTPEFSGRDFATLFIGFGVGMGLRLGGSTFQGQRSSAVEFGHINHIPGGALCRCGNHGCVEAYAGDYAIWRRAQGKVDAVPTRRISDADMHRLAALARGGESEAAAAFEEAGLAIGYGLGRVFTLIDPLPIVFTGSGAHAMDLLEPAIRRGIRESAIDGSGADTAFSIAEDVDQLIFSAATAHALAALDDRFARFAGTEIAEAA